MATSVVTVSHSRGSPCAACRKHLSDQQKQAEKEAMFDIMI